jgi:hypothetical protein
MANRSLLKNVTINGHLQGHGKTGYASLDARRAKSASIIEPVANYYPNSNQHNDKLPITGKPIYIR